MLVLRRSSSKAYKALTKEVFVLQTIVIASLRRKCFHYNAAKFLESCEENTSQYKYFLRHDFLVRKGWTSPDHGRIPIRSERGEGHTRFPYLQGQSTPSLKEECPVNPVNLLPVLTEGEFTVFIEIWCTLFFVILFTVLTVDHITVIAVNKITKNNVKQISVNTGKNNRVNRTLFLKC